MKKLKLFFSTFALIALCNTNLSAQTTFDVPPNAELNSKEDFVKYEPDIIAASKWLEATDLDKEIEKRKQVSAFVLKWVIGSPTVNVSIDEQLGKIYGKNADLLLIYLSSYTRYFLENKSTATKFLGTKAGLTSIMNVYKKGIEITKSKEMDKLIKLTEENKLDDYINEKFK